MTGKTYTIELTEEQALSLREKLDIILTKVRADTFGVDLWLSPGQDTGELLLDVDEPAVDELKAVYNMLCNHLGEKPKMFL